MYGDDLAHGILFQLYLVMIGIYLIFLFKIDSQFFCFIIITPCFWGWGVRRIPCFFGLLLMFCLNFAEHGIWSSCILMLT